MPTEVTVMSRKGCHLCEVMKADLGRVLPDYGLQSTVVDIDSDPELRAEYGDRVPVLLLDGEEHAELRLDEPALRAALDAARGQ